MAKATKPPLTITEHLRKALKRTTTYAVSYATGVPKASLIRFLRGEQSLRLDSADKLAAHFKLMLVKEPR